MGPMAVLAAMAGTVAGWQSSASGQTLPEARAHIKHMVIIVLENRSFDAYFGAFPGVDGLTRTTCVPFNPSKLQLGCARPVHSTLDVENGGPHGDIDQQNDIDDGITRAAMDGYVYDEAHHLATVCGKHGNTAQCNGDRSGAAVMNYHTDAEIPNYWEYAHSFVLQDRLFEGVRSWSGPSHFEMASEWSAKCSNPNDQTTCVTDPSMVLPTSKSRFPWANLMQLFDLHGVTWKWYLGYGAESDCADGQDDCPPIQQSTGVDLAHNPVPTFKYVQDLGTAYINAHNPMMDQFLVDLKTGTLPQVSWIIPSAPYSDHPPSSTTTAEEYVTALINAVMKSPDWQDTAIYLTWDDFGGFYDHAVPPNVATNLTTTPIEGFGIRVPGLMISAWAKKGYVDHQLFSLDSYTTFAENLFAGGARLDPAALGIPDSRPIIPDALTTAKFLDGHSEPIGDLLAEFDFSQAARKPDILSVEIPTEITATCANSRPGTCTTDSVTISWAPVTNNGVIDRTLVYHIARDGVDLSACTGTATTCADTVTTGVHDYRAYTVDSAATKDATSPLSAAAEIDAP